MDRNNLIGSSEIAAACGMSRWKSPLKLWAEKTGKIEPDDLSEVEAVEWGIRLENVVAEKFAEKHNVKLMAYKKRFVHDTYDYISCELDRIITGTDEIVEVKTCNAWKYKEWQHEDDIPIEYQLQVQLALGLSNRKIGWFAVLVGGNKYLEKKIEFDQEIYDMLVEKAVDFWENYVKIDVPPAAVVGDKDTLAKLYPEEKRTELIDVSETEAMKLDKLFLQRDTQNEIIKEAAKLKEDAENKIKEFLEEDQGVVTANYKATWKASDRTYVDAKKLKDAGIYDKYSYKKKSRILRVSEIKENENGKEK